MPIGPVRAVKAAKSTIIKAIPSADSSLPTHALVSSKIHFLDSGSILLWPYRSELDTDASVLGRSIAADAT